MLKEMNDMLVIMLLISMLMIIIGMAFAINILAYIGVGGCLTVILLGVMGVIIHQLCKDSKNK